jgi:hypothetical protein
LNAVRALVLPDQLSFASAAWFLVTQCPPEVRTQLQTGSDAGWAAYITTCLGTEPGPRQAYWQAAVKALGGAGSVQRRGLGGLAHVGAGFGKFWHWIGF